MTLEAIPYTVLPSEPTEVDNECPICFTAMQVDLVVHCPEKGKEHVFHRNCLGEWFKANQTCPTCKAPLSPFSESDPVPPPGAAPQRVPLSQEEVRINVAPAENAPRAAALPCLDRRLRACIISGGVGAASIGGIILKLALDLPNVEEHNDHIAFGAVFMAIGCSLVALGLCRPCARRNPA